MQAQAIRQEQSQDVLTAAQSLQSIQTLLRAGLGCITYLRNLLPADNFSESYLTSAALEPQPSIPSMNGSFSSETSRRNVSGFKIMTVTRGFTEEADKLLDYLENGIFDALQKQYLRSFIFAVYLDSQDPNNIVEAYTFNFHYYTIPGSGVTIPVMSLGDDLMKLSISGNKRKGGDPVADATKQGKPPTLGEVKRSLKTLIKNLIQATTQMDALPRRRFATFKLFYHDHTPDDYEPPHFRPGDSKKDKWFFSTHDKNELPEKCSIGQVQTGWHGVDLRVASVSGYLPSAEDNNAPFAGTTTGGGGDLAPPPLTPAAEADLRRQQIDAQKQDALQRRVVWDAEEGLSDVDADGEVDDGDDSQVMGVWRMNSSGLEFVAPMGIRDADGRIVPLENENATEPNESTSTNAALFKGMEEKVPRHVGQLDLPATNSGELTQTQLVGDTQHDDPASEPPSSSGSSLSSPDPPTPKTRQVVEPTLSQVYAADSLPPSDPIGFSIPSNVSFQEDQTVDTQLLKKRIAVQRRTRDDAEMLEMNTQAEEDTEMDDAVSAHAFTDHHKSMTIVPDTQPDTQISDVEDRTHCECGVDKEDCDCIMCCTCQRWFHAWCMGFHHGNSRHIPKAFACFDCRVQADQNWELIMVHDLYSQMMERFRDLALFRRAIKIFETVKPEGLSGFTKAIGCEPLVAGQLFKRLENEGFIVLEGSESSTEDASKPARTSKGKFIKKQAARRRTMQKPRYIFVRKVLRERKYKDYFDANPDVEKRLLGLEDLKPKHTARTVIAGDTEDDMEDVPPAPSVSLEVSPAQSFEIPIASQASQTQPETQLILDTGTQPEDYLKRQSTCLSEDDHDMDRDERAKKKVKISIGPAVDLGD